MKSRKLELVSLVTALAFAFGCLVLPRSAQAQNVSQTATAGPYSVNLKVLPAESFQGSNAEMVRDGGAQPNTLQGSSHPNHHMVAFIKENGKPVEKATVKISYCNTSANKGSWTTLPVVRMHVAGKGPETTHFGNNVDLPAGSYDVRVTVDGKGPATFHISL